MNKLYIYLILSLFLLSSTYAVLEETSTYRIECTPEVSTITSKGFVQECSYLLKQGTYTGDVAFCFDSTLKSAKVIYNNSDITSLFKYKYYNMVKGNCYYIEDVNWNTNESKKLTIYYMPSNVSSSPKWDTYFGDVSTNRIDLMLDPLYDSNNYEIGTSRSNSYNWMIFNYNSYFNDVLTTSNINTNSTSITTLPTNNLITLTSNVGFPYPDGLTLLGTFNSTYFNNVSINASTRNPNGGIYNISMSVNFTYSDGSSNYIVYPFSLLASLPSFNFSSNTSKNLSYYYLYYNKKSMTNNQPFYIDTNTTTYQTIHSSANLTSNPIALPILVNNFRLNSSYVGSAFINLTFDGINWMYYNLSNNSLNTNTGVTALSSNMSYKLYLLNNATTINNLNIYFNGYSTLLNITVLDEVTGLPIYSNTTVTFSSVNPFTTFSYIVNYTKGVTNLSAIPYSILASNPSYSVKNYYLSLADRSNSNLTIYLNNGNATLFNFKASNGNVLPNVIFNVYSYVNGSLVLTESDISDVTGKVQISTRQNTFYSFATYLNGYANYSFSLNPILFNSYDVILSPTGGITTIPSASVSYNPTIYSMGINNAFTIRFSSPYSSLSNYSYIVTSYNATINGSGNSSSGQYFNNTFFIPKSPADSTVIVYYEYYLTNGIYKNFTYVYSVPITYVNHTLVTFGQDDYGLMVGDKIWIVTFIVLPIVGLAFLFSGSMTFALFVAMVIFGIFGSVKFIPPSVAVGVCVLGFIYIIGKGSS